MAFLRPTLATIALLCCSALCRPPVSAETSPAKGQANKCSSLKCHRWQQCVKSSNGSVQCGCSNTPCPKSGRRVCATDSHTYENRCAMRQRSCRIRSRLRVRHEGECRVRTVLAVGTTTPSLAASLTEKTTSPSRSASSCDSFDCPSDQLCVVSPDNIPRCVCPHSCDTGIRRVVCGSDGRTYLNPCLLKETACIRRETIVIVWEGHCAHRPPATPAVTHAHQSIDGGSPTDTVVNPGSSESPNIKRTTVIHRSTNSPTTTSISGDLLTLTDSDALSVSAPPTRTTGSSLTHTKTNAMEPCSLKACQTGQECRLIEDRPTCVPCPKECPKDRDTVCGSDGNTYKNPCILKQKACRRGLNIQPVSEGRCQHGSPTSPPNDDRCSGHQCSKGQHCVVRGGQPTCVCSRSCSATYRPVCATDGLSYLNRCQMKVAACVGNRKLQAKHNGACTVPKRGPCVRLRCPEDRVCVVHEERAKCVCKLNCTFNAAPVCGSDGRTYWSECNLRMESCRRSVLITVKHHGECLQTDLCSSVRCPSAYKCRIVGGKTKCQVHCIGCSSSQTCVDWHGEPRCLECPQDCSSLSGSSICASNRQLYSSICHMRQAICHQKLNITAVNMSQCRDIITPSPTTIPRPIAAKGAHCRALNCQFGSRCRQTDSGVFRCVCDMNCSVQPRSPVCSKDGKAYGNDCERQLEECKQQKNIPVVEKERCPPATSSSPSRESCAWCKDYGKLYVPLFKKACKADLVVIGHIHVDNTSAVAVSGHKSVSFIVESTLKATMAVPKLSKNSKVIMHFSETDQCNCNLAEREKIVVMAAHWHGDQSLDEGHVELANPNTFLQVYTKKPWKLWRAFYRYGHDLRKLVCGEL